MTVDILFQFTKQKGYNHLLLGPVAPGTFGLGNVSIQALDSWQEPGDQTNIQRFTQSYFSDAAIAYLDTKSSDAAYDDASFIRLKNVSLSYTFSEGLFRKVKLSNCRVFVQGQNILTITNYKGLDPETNRSASLPPLRMITGGLQISF